MLLTDYQTATPSDGSVLRKELYGKYSPEQTLHAPFAKDLDAYDVEDDTIVMSSYLQGDTFLELDPGAVYILDASTPPSPPVLAPALVDDSTKSSPVQLVSWVSTPATLQLLLSNKSSSRELVMKLSLLLMKQLLKKIHQWILLSNELNE